MAEQRHDSEDIPQRAITKCTEPLGGIRSTAQPAALKKLLRHPEYAVAADDLLALTRELLHADLLFPLTKQDRVLHDYSALELPFPATDSLVLPKRCPVRLAHYLSLSAGFALAHPGRVCAPWTYDWFYLEILCIEKKLKPRFWAKWEAIGMGMPLIESSADLALRSGRNPDKLHQQAKLWWEENLGQLVESRAVTQRRDKPWLDQLALEELPGDWPEDAVPLVMTCFPVYLWPQDGMVLAREMRNELFQTSIFSPSSADGLRNTAFQRLRDRFAIGLRKKGWGEASGARVAIRDRDARMLSDFESGKSKYRIAETYGLSYRAVYHALARARRTRQESVTKTHRI